MTGHPAGRLAGAVIARRATLVDLALLVDDEARRTHSHAQRDRLRRVSAQLREIAYGGPAR